MRYLSNMVIEGMRLLHHDPYLGGLIGRTLELAFVSTAIALILGLPAGCAIGLGRDRLSGSGLVLANAGLGLPPVAVGVYVVVLLPGIRAPWGGTWLGTMSGMTLGQTVLGLPVIVALTAVAIKGLPEGLTDQARAYGASGWRLGMFALREARIGVITAVIIALGAGIAEVGAVTLIGGNSVDTTATLASEIINDVHNTTTSGLPSAVEHGMVILAIMLILGVILTAVQNVGGSRGRWRRLLRSSARQGVAT